MTYQEPNKIIAKLATSVDVDSTIGILAKKYPDRNDLVSTRTSLSIKARDLDTITLERAKYMSIFKEQYEVRKNISSANCHKMATSLVQEELKNTDTIVGVLNKYCESYNKMKVNMDLMYRVNKLHNLSNIAATKIALKDVPTYQSTYNHLLVLQKALDQLVDLKSFMYFPVKRSTYDNGFTDILDMFSYDEVLQQHIRNFILHDTPDIDHNLRLEYYRDIKSTMTASEAGYDNMTCMSIIKSLNKLADTVSNLTDQWYISAPRYRNNQTRVNTVLKSTISQSFTGDDVSHYNTILHRTDRYRTAVKFVTMVVCPMILKEMDNILTVMDGLRTHLVLDENSKVPTITPELGYTLEQSRYNDLQFFKFISNDTDYDILFKSMDYVSNRSDKLGAMCTTISSKFNRAEAHPVKMHDVVSNVHIDTLSNNMTQWASVLQSYSKYIQSTFNTTSPIISGETYLPSIEEYIIVTKNCKSICTKHLDVTYKDSSDKYTRYELISPYRNTLDKQSKVSSSELGYTDKDKQWGLKLSLDTLFSSIRETYETLGSTSTFLSKIKIDRDKSAKQTQAMKYCLADLSTIMDFIKYDLKLIEMACK